MVDFNRIEMDQTECALKMFNVLSETQEVYASILKYLNSNRAAKAAFFNSEVRDNTYRNSIIQAISRHSDIADFNNLKKYFHLLKPHCYVIIDAFNTYKNKYKKIILRKYIDTICQFNHVYSEYQHKVIDKLCEIGDSTVSIIAHKMKSDKVSVSERKAHGYLGLVTAAHRYRFDVGVKFTTYADWWIRETIGQGIRSDIFITGCDSVTYDNFVTSVSRKKETLSEQQKYELEQLINPLYYDSDEIANFSAEYIEHYDAPESWYNKGPQLLQSVLSPIEYKIVVDIFGLFDNHEKSIVEITEDTQLSYFKINTIKKNALVKLRRSDIQEILGDAVFS